MASQLLVEKAIELKNVIDNAHIHLPDIGRCLSLELEYRHNYHREDDDNSDFFNDIDNDDDEEEETVLDKLEEMQEKLQQMYKTKGFERDWSGIHLDRISVLGQEFQPYGLGPRDCSIISKEHVKEWYEAGTSPPGNSFRELDASQFTVPPDLLDDLAATWTKHFMPSSITVRPDKIMLYSPGDHGQPPKETPETDICGTFLVSLFSNSEPWNVFEIKSQQGHWMPWKPWRRIEWCAFYPDITYRVNTLATGYRATLSFKVFATEPGEWNSNSVNKAHMEAFVQSLLALNRPVGILLKSYNREGVSGCDKLLLDTLENHGVQVDLTPVLIHFSGEAPDLEEITTQNNVLHSHR
jgi:hypothetical protein